MKDYYSILKSFFSKTNNQERLSQLEKIKNNQTALIKLFNQIKPESKDYSINKNTMKLSEFKSYIQEEIIEILSEETAEDIQNKAKAQAELNKELEKTKDLMKEEDEDDIIKVTENLNPEVIKAVDRFIKGMAKRYSYSEQDAIFAIEQALAKRQPSMTTDMPGFEGTMDALDSLSIREEKEDDMDKQASEAAEEEKSIAKEKEDALEFQEETKDKIKKIKKDLEANKSEMLKILKIDRKDRTKAEQSLFDKMADKTKELKKLEKTL